MTLYISKEERKVPSRNSFSLFKVWKNVPGLIYYSFILYGFNKIIFIFLSYIYIDIYSWAEVNYYMWFKCAFSYYYCNMQPTKLSHFLNRFEPNTCIFLFLLHCREHLLFTHITTPPPHPAPTLTSPIQHYIYKLQLLQITNYNLISHYLYKLMSFIFDLYILCPNNLSRGLNLPKTGFS